MRPSAMVQHQPLRVVQVDSDTTRREINSPMQSDSTHVPCVDSASRVSVRFVGDWLFARLVVLFVCLGTVTPTAVARACSCRNVPPVRIESNAAAIVGVIERTSVSGFVVRVERVRSTVDVPRRIRVVTNFGSRVSQCRFDLVVGRRYVFHVWHRDGDWFSSECSHSHRQTSDSFDAWISALFESE